MWFFEIIQISSMPYTHHPLRTWGESRIKSQQRSVFLGGKGRDEVFLRTPDLIWLMYSLLIYCSHGPPQGQRKGSDIKNQKNEELKPAVQTKTSHLIGMMRDLHLFLFFPLFYRQRADSREGLRCSHDLWLLQTEPSQEAAAAAPLWTAGTRRHRVTKPICPQL